MKLSTKAALYSFIVFPGAGYFIIKEKKRGTAVFIISIIVLIIYMFEAFHKAQIIAEKMVSGQLPLFDINVIRTEIPLIEGVVNPNLLVGISILLSMVWVLSIFDSFRLAKIKEAHDNING